MNTNTLTLQKKTELMIKFIKAHRDYEKGLYDHASYRINDRARGQDLVQDTFMKTWAYLVKNGEVNMMKAFLYRVLNDLIIDEYRKRKTTSLDVLVEKGFEPVDSDSERFVNIIDGRNAARLIGRLPTNYQKVMRMRYMQDLSLAEMSRATGQTKNTLAVKVHRGVEKLRRVYATTSSLSHVS